MRLNRLDDMEQYILNKGSVSLENLASQFHVSLNTVRRDLKELLEHGNIQKVYGGVSAKYNNLILPMAERSSKNSSAKQKIGQLACEMVNDGDTIFLDSGSTVLCSIPYLARKNDITIITHSLSAMYEASRYPNLQLISLGGLYNRTTSSFVGFSTMEALSNIVADIIFIAATGVSLDRGLTNTTYFEAEIKRKVVHSGNKVILLADQSKFDYSSSISFFDFKDLYGIITDQKPSPKYVDAIKKNNIILKY